MTARQFLDQYRDLERRARRFKIEYERELELIDTVKSTADIDGLPHGNGIRKPVEDRAIRLADKAAAWKIAELEALEARQRVFELICDIPDIEGDILFLRYIQLYTWKQVMSEIHLTWPPTRNRHLKALDIVQKKLYTNIHIGM